jgi:maltose phosphorylase
LHITINNEELDLNKVSVLSYYQEIDMKTGILKRKFTVKMPSGLETQIETERFVSMTKKELGCISFKITVLNSDATIVINSNLDFDVKNHDSNYDEVFWEQFDSHADETSIYVGAKTKKSDFYVYAATTTEFLISGKPNIPQIQYFQTEKTAGKIASIKLAKNEKLVILKYAVILSSENYQPSQLPQKSVIKLNDYVGEGYNHIRQLHIQKWEEKWQESDIEIEGDLLAQQGIRYNIFQLTQTYTGENPKLNVGPKGFTGEKYGGATYWDTEAYCVPYFLNAAPSSITRNLLIYRYRQLNKAIENAQKLGFNRGAALYPMVTMNGEECHNEWEITFEEIHRNGAISHSIYNYVRHTADDYYLAEYGLEVLIAVARFWAQRVNFSTDKNQYVILGVTGPNEYENNVNNNWYTNRLAAWCLDYTLEAIELVKSKYSTDFDRIKEKTNLSDLEDLQQWKTISSNMYYPMLAGTKVFLQQDGYMDKEQILVKELSPIDRPLNQKWSWDRILRSCFIKQADVLQGLYFLEHLYDLETIKENFDFYEPRTVHESSLSPSIHSILAVRIGNFEKAYEMYLRTSRLDLDDYNKEAHEGLHITSMAGTLISVIEGFGGVKVMNNQLHLLPHIPENWKQLSFKIHFRKRILSLSVSQNICKVTLLSGEAIELNIYQQAFKLQLNETIQTDRIHHLTTV